MQLHVQLTKVQLTASHHTSIKSFLIAQLLEHFFRHGFTGLVVLGETIHRGFIVTPVFHELRRELHGVPFHTIDSGNVSDSGLGQHVLQSAEKRSNDK